MTTTRLQYLLDRYYQQQATPEEETELLAYVAQLPEPSSLDDLLQQHWESLSMADPQYTPATGAPMLEAILGTPQRKVFRLSPIVRWAAAAVVVGAVAAGFWWRTAYNTPTDVTQASLIKPGYSRAVLTLGNGKTVVLDSTGHQQIDAGVSQQGGQLLYADNAAGAPQFNTLTTPRGGQFRVTLPDGTEAWLNASSSLTYPTAFEKAQRLVTVKGEVYFAVAKDAARPFQVRVDDGPIIDVLGTEFNVNAYTDEPSINTTLVQGKVSVHLGSTGATVLQPGQQARTYEGGLKVLPAVDVEQVTAWKNGVFNFEGVDLPGVMRQLSRWYDVEVVYAGKIPQHRFGGEIQRGLQLKQVLDILDVVGIKFKIQGKQLIVLPE